MKRPCDEDEESEPLAKRAKLGEDAAKMLVCDESVDPCEQDEDTASYSTLLTLEPGEVNEDQDLTGTEPEPGEKKVVDVTDDGVECIDLDAAPVVIWLDGAAPAETMVPVPRVKKVADVPVAADVICLDDDEPTPRAAPRAAERRAARRGGIEQPHEVIDVESFIDLTGESDGEEPEGLPAPMEDEAEDRSETEPMELEPESV